MQEVEQRMSSCQEGWGEEVLINRISKHKHHISVYQRASVAAEWLPGSFHFSQPSRIKVPKSRCDNTLEQSRQSLSDADR